MRGWQDLLNGSEAWRLGIESSRFAKDYEHLLIVNCPNELKTRRRHASAELCQAALFLTTTTTVANTVRCVPFKSNFAFCCRHHLAGLFALQLRCMHPSHSLSDRFYLKERLGCVLLCFKFRLKQQATLATNLICEEDKCLG